MTPSEIITTLQDRGNRDIHFHEDGRITGWYGRQTLNTWLLINNELVAVGCRTVDIRI